jgi:hypothetical protein
MIESFLLSTITVVSAALLGIYFGSPNRRIRLEQAKKNREINKQNTSKSLCDSTLQYTAPKKVVFIYTSNFSLSS